MSKLAIRVKGLSKRYQIGQRVNYRRLTESLTGMLAAPFRRREKQGDGHFWALKDVSFDLRQGEVLGIIGRNGAGKSTLLKILSRVTEMTEGNVDLYGRIGSLLEVGTGFHPELTGRENIFLNGAILGMKRPEIRRKFDEIVDFAEVEKFLDTPVKHYSSGMYMRLAFAVAAHLEPEILVVDEVLAVGDAQFQKKCLGRMSEVAKDGRTVLFVSHNLAAVAQLCTSCIVLTGGQITYAGAVPGAIHAYESAQRTTATTGSWQNTVADDGTQEAYVERFELTAENGQPRDTFANSETVCVRIRVRVRQRQELLKVGFELIKASTVVWRIHHVDTVHPMEPLPVGTHVLTCRIPPHLLNLGEYLIVPQASIHCVKDVMKMGEPVLRFNVQLDPSVSSFHGILNERNHAGVIFPLLQWDAEAVAERP